jgi:hypothetical protein
VGGNQLWVFRKKMISLENRKLEWLINPLLPDLNPCAQRRPTKFLLGVLLLEPHISLIYAWKTNKCNNYSFSLLIIYGSSYMINKLNE